MSNTNFPLDYSAAAQSISHLKLTFNFRLVVIIQKVQNIYTFIKLNTVWVYTFHHGIVFVKM